MKIKTSLLLLLFLVSACVSTDKDKTMPSSQQEVPSSPGETPSLQVLADCFLTFDLSAWHDLDSNGEWNGKEPPLEGVAFRVNGPFASMLTANPCLSDQQGACQIRTWAPGACMAADFAVKVDPPESFVSTTPSEIIFSLAPTDFQQSSQFGFVVDND